MPVARGIGGRPHWPCTVGAYHARHAASRNAHRGGRAVCPAADMMHARVDTEVQRPRIAVIGTGGTFAMHGRHRFDWIEYADSGVIHPIEDLLQRLGELAPATEIVPIPF